VTEAPFTTSDAHATVVEAYYHALAKGLSVLKSKTADTGKYSYAYADLTDVLYAINTALAEKGCCISQIPSGTPDGLVWTLTTTILHSSGQWLAFAPYTRPQVRDEQGFGSALTYARRYSLLAIFGIAPEDDDGSEATRQQRNAVQFGGKRTAEELAIYTIIAGLPSADAKIVVEHFKENFRSIMSELPEHRHAEALAWVVMAVSALRAEQHPPAASAAPSGTLVPSEVPEDDPMFNDPK
jgi:hypothetical protein